jgi:hypothetical protein
MLFLYVYVKINILSNISDLNKCMDKLFNSFVNFIKKDLEINKKFYEIL